VRENWFNLLTILTVTHISEGALIIFKVVHSVWKTVTL